MVPLFKITRFSYEISKAIAKDIIQQVKKLAELRTYENFPLRIVLLTNLFSLTIYLIGFYIMLNLGIIFAVLFAAYILWIEIRLLAKSCRYC